LSRKPHNQRIMGQCRDDTVTMGGAGPPYQGDLTGNGTPAPRCIHANRNERKVFSVKVETKCLMEVRVLQYPLVLTKEPKSHVDTEYGRMRLRHRNIPKLFPLLL
jgi:hypothetical protein